MDVDAITKIKEQTIDDFLKWCKLMSNGYDTFCYQDLLNKILFIETYKDLDNRDSLEKMFINF